MPHQIVALLAWYDEQETHLERMIHSLPLAGVTHLIALDGAYRLLPDGHPSSPASQHDAIRQACKTARITLTLRIPNKVWQNNEIEKRTTLFHLAEQKTTPDSWYVVLDADEEITKVPADFQHRIATTDRDAVEVTFCESRRQIQLRMIFRAIRGLHAYKNHYSYQTPDGRRLWGHHPQGPLVPALGCSDLYVRHHLSERTFQRDNARRRYYQDRDRLKAEVPANA